jgi:hypothetical protein
MGNLDRLLDRRLSFREKIEWLEEAERLSLAMHEARRQRENRIDVKSQPGSLLTSS